MFVRHRVRAWLESCRAHRCRVHPKELEARAFLDQREMRGVGILGAWLREQQVDVIEMFGPMVPEAAAMIVRRVDGEPELIERGWRSVLGIDLVAEGLAHAQYLFADDREGRGDERGPFDHGDARSMHQTEIAHVVPG